MITGGQAYRRRCPRPAPALVGAVLVLVAGCSGADTGTPTGTSIAGPPLTTAAGTVVQERPDPMPKGSPFDAVVQQVLATNLSYSIEATVVFDPENLAESFPKSITYRADGGCEAPDNRCSMTLDSVDITKTMAPAEVRGAYRDAGDEAFKQDLVFDGDAVYLRFPRSESSGRSAGLWVKVPLDDGSNPRPTVDSRGLGAGFLPATSPLTLTRFLVGVASEAQNQDRDNKFKNEKRLRAEISLQKVLDRSPNPVDQRAIRSSLHLGTTDLMGRDPGPIPVDIALDADGRLAEIKMRFDIAAPKTAVAGTPRIIGLDVDVRFTAAGGPVSIVVPAGNQVVASAAPVPPRPSGTSALPRG